MRATFMEVGVYVDEGRIARVPRSDDGPSYREQMETLIDTKSDVQRETALYGFSQDDPCDQ